MTTQTMEIAAPTGAVFAVDPASRTIRGMAVPYGVEGFTQGRRFMFSLGTIRPREPGFKVKLWALHEKAHASGVVTEWNDTPAGLEVAFQVAETPEGDRALANAAAGVWDSFSIGPSEGAKYVIRDGVHHAVDIPIHEISLTPAPVFGGARVTSVAFDTDHQENSMETDTLTTDPPAVEAPGVDFSALTHAMTQGIAAGFASLANPQGDPETRDVVSAGGRLEVTESIPYRFDGPAGDHSLLEDMRSARQGDSEARQRFETFVEQSFAVTAANVGSLNPVQNRPELFVPNLTFTRPLFEAISTGTITDKTPFTVPKFASAGGLVGNHVEGVEPTPGNFAATVQTVSPGPMSGKIEINREVLDQGGSPQADGIIWGEMLNAWFEAIEAKIAAALQAVPTAELNLASAVDTPLVDAMVNYFAQLQFVRGGNRYTGLVLDGLLFPALINAKDLQGRKLLPVLGPTNAQGTTDGNFARVAIGSQSGRAAWALGATNASRSFSFVPSSVWAWVSAPKRFDFEYQLKSVDLGIWGYCGTAVLRDSDVKPIDYTTLDS